MKKILWKREKNLNKKKCRNEFDHKKKCRNKFNHKKETSDTFSSEEINNSLIIKSNLEKKDSANSQSTGDNVCDNKSINSLETTNTINEEEIERVEELYSKSKIITEDFKPIKVKNSKLSCLSTHNFDFSKHRSKDTELYFSWGKENTALSNTLN